MKINLLYEIARLMVHLYSMTMFNMDIKSYSILPEGPKLYVANHPSAVDPFVIHLLDRMSILISANAFAFPLFGTFLRLIGQVPAEPSGDSVSRAANLLQQGKSVGIFPEGTFSPQSGGFGEPRTGAARLALKTGVPLIPVGISLKRERTVRIASNLAGRETVGYWYFFGPYAITVGQPLTFEGDADDRNRVLHVTQVIMGHIKSLAQESEMRMHSALQRMRRDPRVG